MLQTFQVKYRFTDASESPFGYFFPFLLSIFLERFKCSVCGGSYQSATYLKVHMNLHTKEREFGCEKCKMVFYMECGCLEHQKRCTGKVRIVFSPFLHYFRRIIDIIAKNATKRLDRLLLFVLTNVLILV